MLTVVYPYYCNGGMLERHLEEWASYAPDVKARMRAIVIDDGSPRDPALDHMSHPGFDVELYRIKQNLVWNVAGARNLGMHVAPEGWCLLTDIDHLLPAADAERLVDFLLLEPVDHQRPLFYIPARAWARGEPLEPHTNTYILQRSLYWRIGGCDEDWTGWWGAGEPVFRKHIYSIAQRVDLPNICLRHYGRDDIADASTTEWGRKNTPYHWSNNPALVEKFHGKPYRPDHPLRFDWERVDPGARAEAVNG